MDLLDSLDSNANTTKSNKVRSWYYYEQYKSLERNQLNAAQTLRRRSHQGSILRQELSERRARRRLYEDEADPADLAADNHKKDAPKSPLSVSTEDLYESISQLHESDRDGLDQSPLSGCESEYSEFCLADFQSVGKADDRSESDSVNSVVENHKFDALPSDSKTELAFETKLVEDISQQLDTVKRNIKCLEDYTRLCDDGYSDDSMFSDKSIITRKQTPTYKSSSECKTAKVCCSNRAFGIWSKLVSFAYQITQLHHGICYCNLSTQMLTAVLACDVLRRGVNCMALPK